MEEKVEVRIMAGFFFLFFLFDIPARLGRGSYLFAFICI